MSPSTRNIPDLSRLDAALDSRYWNWIFLDQARCPATLVECLKENLAHLSPDSWSERFEWGGIYLNGRLQDGDTRLVCPCKVEYYEPKESFETARRTFPRLTERNIIYRDDDLVVIFKPARLPTMPAKEQRHFSAKADIETIVGKVVHVPSRLDMSVSGLVPMSTSSRMHPLLQAVFENRLVDKTYVSATSVRPPWQAVSCVGAIGRSAHHPILREVVESGGQASATTFSIIGESDPSGGIAGTVFFTAKPITGRTHQIRVHAAFMGCPIVGDNFYGGAQSLDLNLCCARLAFTHPISGVKIDVQIPSEFAPKWLPPDALQKLCTADSTGL